MAIDNKISGWQSMKAKLKQVIGVANKVENLTIMRGGTVDSVTFAGDSIKINVRDFPKSKTGGGGGDALPTPLLMVQIDATTIAFHYGTVSSIVPTISATPLDPDVSLNTITVSANTTYWLDATVAAGIVTAIAIVSADPGADTDLQAKQIIGAVTWDGGGAAIDTIAPNLTGSQNVDSCGATHSWNVV